MAATLNKVVRLKLGAGAAKPGTYNVFLCMVFVMDVLKWKELWGSSLCTLKMCECLLTVLWVVVVFRASYRSSIGSIRSKYGGVL
jgi:hypothetical protein